MHPILTEWTRKCLPRAFPLCNISIEISVALNSIRTSHVFSRKHLAFQERAIKNEKMGRYRKETAELHTTCQLISDAVQPRKKHPYCHACPRPLQPAESFRKSHSHSQRTHQMVINLQPLQLIGLSEKSLSLPYFPLPFHSTSSTSCSMKARALGCGVFFSFVF